MKQKNPTTIRTSNVPSSFFTHSPSSKHDESNNRKKDNESVKGFFENERSEILMSYSNRQNTYLDPNEDRPE